MRMRSAIRKGTVGSFIDSFNDKKGRIDDRQRCTSHLYFRAVPPLHAHPRSRFPRTEPEKAVIIRQEFACLQRCDNDGFTIRSMRICEEELVREGMAERARTARGTVLNVVSRSHGHASP
jgi:hypothetical protein